MSTDLTVPEPSVTIAEHRRSRFPFLAAPSTAYAWILLSGYGLMLGIVSLFWLLRGQLFDSVLYDTVGGMSWALMKALDAGVVNLVAALIRLGGALGIVAAVLVVAVAATAYRRGERWAWYAMWAPLLVPVFDLAVLAGYGALSLRSILWDAYMLALLLLGLLLPYRAFFATEKPVSP